MKQILHLLLLLAPFVLQAQSLWSPIAAMPTDSDYYIPSMSVAGDDNIWITTITISGTEMAHHWHLSTDGGSSWTDGIIPLESAALGMSNIDAVSATTAYVAVHSPVASEAGGILKTEDAGATWTKIPSLFSTVGASFPNFIHFFDAEKGVCAGDPASGYFEIYTTSNSGVDWTRIPAGDIPAPLIGEYGQLSNVVVQNDHIWFQTNKGRIFQSADMGLTWQVHVTPITDFGGVNSFDYAFSNNVDGILVSNYHEYYRTDDGGANFIPFLPSSDVNLAIRNMPLWYIPDSNTSYFSGGYDSEMDQKGSSFFLRMTVLHGMI